MAEEKNIKRKNYVNLTGYLKENTLKVVKSSSGVEAISGSLIIATSETDAHKVQFYANKVFKSGKENSLYKELDALMPSKTISIASYVKQNPTSNYATAAQCSTKVYVGGSLEEYATKLDGKERSIITIRGSRARIKTVTDAHPFVPSATFNVDMYIESMREESKWNKDREDMELTGRHIIVGLIPDYLGCMNKIEFVVPKDRADFVKSNYANTDTANFTGEILNTETKIVKKTVSDDPFAWNNSKESQYETEFIRERRIMGRDNGSLPIHQGEEGSITIEEVKNGLVLRDEKILKNTQNRGNKNNTSSFGTRNVKSVENEFGFTDSAQSVGSVSDFNLDDF